MQKRQSEEKDFSDQLSSGKHLIERNSCRGAFRLFNQIRLLLSLIQKRARVARQSLQ